MCVCVINKYKKITVAFYHGTYIEMKIICDCSEYTQGINIFLNSLLFDLDSTNILHNIIYNICLYVCYKHILLPMIIFNYRLLFYYFYLPTADSLIE